MARRLVSAPQRRVNRQPCDLEGRDPRAPRWLEPLVQAEIRSLTDLDVPSFRRAAGSRRLRVGPAARTEFFRESPIGRAERRLRALGPNDRSRQLQAIRTALSST